MRVLSPIVIGLTSPLNASIPPIEPFYGFPRIPAQLVRSAIKEHLVSIGKTALANELSGEVGESSSKKGTLRTFDAVPADEQNLRINYDFTTCHSYPYYTEGEPPDDWHEPFPHLFFILPPGMVFEFAFTTGSSQVSIEEITRLMKEALSETGIGARRSRSYGILTHAE
jgi:CRISPR-associated protein Cmr6